MIAFAEALGLDEIDLLGFSIGGFVAQEIALVRPALVRRLVLAALAPRARPGCTAGARTSPLPRSARESADNLLLYHVRAYRDKPGEGR